KWIHLTDPIFPQVNGVINAMAHNYWDPLGIQGIFLFAGESAHVVVRATDNHRLSWLGYEFVTRDSQAVHDAIDSAQFTIQVPHGINSGAYFNIFARDSVGNRTVVQLEVNVIDAVQRAITVLAPWAQWLQPDGEAIYDQKRDWLYLRDIQNGVRVLE